MSVFSSSAVYLASDVFTILRLIHVVNQNWVLVQWSNQKWFFITGVFIFVMAFMSTFGAFLDLVPQYFNENLTYDLFLAFWFSEEHVQFYIQTLMHLSWMAYTLGLFMCLMCMPYARRTAYAHGLRARLTRTVTFNAHNNTV